MKYITETCCGHKKKVWRYQKGSQKL